MRENRVDRRWTLRSDKQPTLRPKGAPDGGYWDEESFKLWVYVVPAYQPQVPDGPDEGVTQLQMRVEEGPVLKADKG